MGKNVIVSEETVRDLLEAHASLSAWYYELSAALRAAQGTARSPDDAARAAFVGRLAQDFPEVAAVARTIQVPRMFVPPPPAMAAGAPLEEHVGDEQSTLIEPAQARFRTTGSNPPEDGDAADAAPTRPPQPGPAAGAPPPGAAPPPPIVDPTKVKY